MEVSEQCRLAGKPHTTPHMRSMRSPLRPRLDRGVVEGVTARICGGFIACRTLCVRDKIIDNWPAPTRRGASVSTTHTNSIVSNNGCNTRRSFPQYSSLTRPLAAQKQPKKPGGGGSVGAIGGKAPHTLPRPPKRPFLLSKECPRWPPLPRNIPWLSGAG